MSKDKKVSYSVCDKCRAIEQGHVKVEEIQ